MHEVGDELLAHRGEVAKLRDVGQEHQGLCRRGPGIKRAAHGSPVMDKLRIHGRLRWRRAPRPT